jgi:hypothetical protein
VVNGNRRVPRPPARIIPFIACRIYPAICVSWAVTGSVPRRAVVEQTIHDNICWALTKDRALADRTVAHDADLFMFNPTSKPTIGYDELAKNEVQRASSTSWKRWPAPSLTTLAPAAGDIWLDCRTVWGSIEMHRKSSMPA